MDANYLKQTTINLLNSILSEFKGIDEKELTKAEENIRAKVTEALENLNTVKV